MGQMADYSIDQLMLFIGGCASAVVLILVASQKGKCKSCCWGCMVRDVDAVLKSERIAKTGHSGDTPQSLRLDLKEPEPEP